jgi:hypothetical protein
MPEKFLFWKPSRATFVENAFETLEIILFIRQFSFVGFRDSEKLVGGSCLLSPINHYLFALMIAPTESSGNTWEARQKWRIESDLSDW